MNVQLPENLRRIQKMLVLKYSAHKSAIQIPIISPLPTKTTYFFAFQANSGRFRISAIQYPLIRNRKVRNAWTAASGTMYVLRRLQRSIGLM
jgi:hypothetical protein